MRTLGMRASLSLEFPSVAPGRAVDPYIRPATQPGNGYPLRRGRRRREPLGELEVLPVVDRAHHDRPSFRKSGGLVDAPGRSRGGTKEASSGPTELRFGLPAAAGWRYAYAITSK